MESDEKIELEMENAGYIRRRMKSSRYGAIVFGLIIGLGCVSVIFIFGGAWWTPIVMVSVLFLSNWTYIRTLTVTGEAVTIDSLISWGQSSRCPVSWAMTIAFADLSTARSVSRRGADFLVLRQLNGEETWVWLGGRRDDVAAIADWVTGHIARQTSAED
jgi:hypothetical protein